MHTALTKAMEAWVASNIETEKNAATTTERFAKWQSHWVERFALLSESEHFLCPCGHESWNMGVCPKCGALARAVDDVVTTFAPFAKVLGHLWAGPEWAKPHNLTELIYLVDGLKMWGSWGYNPPLTYQAVMSSVSPWQVAKVIHTTSKQRFEVAPNGRVYYTLTTTTGCPVATATAVGESFTIYELYPENTIGRGDRWNWLETWVTTFQDLGWEVTLQTWMSVETLSKCEWDEKSHPRLAALQSGF